MFEWGVLNAVLYVWVKAAHIIFVIFWIAGLFLLPRYYIYHQEAPAGSAEEERWLDRERKLRDIILTPSMILVWLFGIALAFMLGAWDQGWLQAKLAFVVLLSAYHGYMVGYGRKLARGTRPKSGRALRLMNEVPGVAAAIIVILVVVKPF